MSSVVLHAFMKCLLLSQLPSALPCHHQLMDTSLCQAGVLVILPPTLVILVLKLLESPLGTVEKISSGQEEQSPVPVSY